MFDSLIYKFCNYDFFSFRDKKIQKRFNDWREASRFRQTSRITILTAALYILYAFLDRLIAPAQTVELMITIHLYAIPSILFLISLLAYLKRYCFWMTSLLIIAPILAAIGNLVIASNFEGYTIYITEIYLIIFWIFTVSGLKLFHATISALTVFLLSAVTIYNIYPAQTNEFIMHIFWMLASLSFGFLDGYLLEDSNRSTFLKQEELEKLASTDKLTGLYNRAKLEEVLKSELDQSKRYGRNFGMLILDIDYFKDINDTYGHLIGDDFLVELTNVIKRSTRSSDTLIRWGGEEFVIICLETDKQDAITLAQNIRQNIEKTPFKTIGSRTVSIGVTINKDDDNVHSITTRADQALYKAKSEGRNRVEFL